MKLARLIEWDRQNEERNAFVTLVAWAALCLSVVFGVDALAQNVTLPVEPGVRYPGDHAPSPHDPLRQQQYALNLTGQAPAPEPWQYRPRIAICDTGIGWWHEDISDDLWAFTVADPDPADDFGHGTHVLGIAAAQTGNGRGISGMAGGLNWPCLSMKVLYEGIGTDARVATGIMLAADMGAEVINCSLQGPASWLYGVAADVAESRGAIVVFAAGNAWGGPVSGMASDPYWIVVSSVDELANPSGFSSIGPRVDFCAGGSNVLSALPLEGRFTYKRVTDLYGAISGTSMAAPHVSGLIVRMLVERDLTRDQAYWALRHTCIDLGEPGHDDYFGWGLIRAPEAVDLVRWNRCDFNRDGIRDSADMIAFQAAYAAREPSADLDLDGEWTVWDCIAFVQEVGP